jgi:uncharacterized protein
MHKHIKMEKINFKNVEKHLLLKTISGSKAYGLDLPTSDTDIRGIFIQPNEYRLGNGYIEQLNDDKNDIVYYELNRFINLLAQNNPNIIEILFVNPDKILFFDKRIQPLYDIKTKFLTKKIQMTFGGYSISQIKKARGLNKKIVNPIDKERKSSLDFCYVSIGNGSVNLKDWLHNQKTIEQQNQSNYGLQNINNMKGNYYLYYSKEGIYKGILNDDLTSTQLRLSSIPKEENPLHIIYFNQDGYSSYCKDYKEYWEWVDKRNPVRYNDNISHDQNYDGKNMMHCLRMLDMAIEIAEGKGVNVLRPNREWLLSVRKGQVKYDEIINLIEEKKAKMDHLFDSCDLPEDVDVNLVHDVILKIRNF